MHHMNPQSVNKSSQSKGGQKVLGKKRGTLDLALFLGLSGSTFQGLLQGPPEGSFWGLDEAPCSRW